MTLTSALQYIAFIILVTLSVKPLGSYMEKVFSRKRTALDWALLPVERGLYRLTGVDPRVEMNWIEYACCFVLFSFAGAVLSMSYCAFNDFSHFSLPGIKRLQLRRILR